MSEVDVRQLTVAQLDQLKTNFENELNSLVSNFQQLKEAQSRFSDSASAIQALPENGEGREMMVPLTSSLYVPGRLTGSNEVLVDIGTGYFVGVSTPLPLPLLLLLLVEEAYQCWRFSALFITVLILCTITKRLHIIIAYTQASPRRRALN